MRLMQHVFFLSVCALCARADVTFPFALDWMNATGRVQYNSLDYPGSIYVVEAYFNGCPPCNQNAENVDGLATKYASKMEVQVLDVGIDRTDSDYSSWISKHHPNHPVLKDAQRKIIGQLGTSAYPSTYVIACNGKVVFDNVGVWDSGTERDLDNAIEDALKIICPLLPQFDGIALRMP